MLDLKQKHILVTGGAGFLGSAVCRVLASRGYSHSVIRSEWCDLTSRRQTHSTISSDSPHVVIHLAARCGGIGANQAAPADFLLDNLAMGMNVIEACLECSVEKLIVVGTVCSYPAENDGPIGEADLWKGYPEPTNAPYGIAKRVVGELLAAYHRQHRMRCAYVIPANLYGPGDNFDPETSHVIPALLRRFVEAARDGAPAVTCWGTGNPTRDFLYVDDAAEGIVRAAERIDSPEPVNLGTGREVSMRRLADMISELVAHRMNAPPPEIRWDPSKPDGQRRRVLDINRAEERLDWAPLTGLEEGLQNTLAWWLEN